MSAPTAPQVDDRTEALLPTLRTLLEVRTETADTATFVVDATGLPAFQPGQIAMIGVLGFGESAISIDGDPLDTDRWEFTIRRAGVVTGALHDLAPGAQVTLRGPFGHGWRQPPRGADLLLVGGGIGVAPLRPAILTALHDRDRLGRVVLVVGARSPADLVLRHELLGWGGRADVEMLLTVDSAADDPQWRGPTGLVTALLTPDVVDPASTHAMVCGPEVMLRFVGRTLTRLGVPPSRIQLALERNMRCAVGTCGHCQLGPVFVCRDGPVVALDRIADELEVPER